ncbi:hypothetical protein ACFFTN_02895 [Aminobacter aganoensis]|uniref:Uncharacterized protein n=1 Tax=Aminobacter aganoensis TaxID=83264 RepID=A0A7X0F6A0_9HYPH|nr:MULTISPECIES: hypothetical protein [Aminobacter]KQU64040.1 hypothetical protein ASC75_15505 [Aminobacter sp. DSM 101952]MBB6353931.1 hypothetical protein [Aminobacter aganoensis]
MIRFVFRLAAAIALSVAVIMAVLDATRTVAVSRLVMTPLDTSWQTASPSTLAATETFVRDKTGPVLWDAAIVPVLNLPGFAVFAVLAFLLYAIGHRRRPGRFTAEV